MNTKKFKFVLDSRFAKEKSVRTTFKLSTEAVEALDFLCHIFKLKPKEVFGLITTRIMIEPKKIVESTKMGKRKTYVISKNSLEAINKNAIKFGISRDLLVQEMLISERKFHSELVKERVQRQQQALKSIEEHIGLGEEFVNYLDALLGDEDPITYSFSLNLKRMNKYYDKINTALKNGVFLDPANPQMLEEL